VTTPLSRVVVKDEVSDDGTYSLEDSTVGVVDSYVEGHGYLGGGSSSRC
jgi:hypothetical protein